MKALRSLLIASLLAAATTAAAQENPWKFEFHGFVSTSAFVQDNATGSSIGGQIPFASANRVATDKALIGADIRQTRFSFTMNGPEVLGGAKPKAVIEFDFFPGNVTGNPTSSQFSEQNLIPRLRIAYSELNWGNTILQVGQQNDLLITSQLPVALGHIAFPICTVAGCLGWRTPGFALYQKMPMDAFNAEFSARLAKSNWNDSTTGFNNTYGQAGSPIMQGRIRLDGKASGLNWMGYVVGHFASLDMTGAGFNANGNGQNGAAPAPYQKDIAYPRVAKLQSIAGQIGGKLNFAPVTLAVNAFTGKNLADVIGDIFSQFQTGGPQTGAVGQIRAKGMWAQLGFDITKNWSAWAFWGANHINEEEAFRSLGATRVANEVDALLIKYTEGAFSTGIDIMNVKTSNAVAYPGFVPSSDGHHTINAITYARQFMYSVNYYF